MATIDESYHILGILWDGHKTLPMFPSVSTLPFPHMQIKQEHRTVAVPNFNNPYSITYYVYTLVEIGKALDRDFNRHSIGYIWALLGEYRSDGSVVNRLTTIKDTADA